MQALLPAIYPILKSGFRLSFGQIGLLTLAFNVTASLLQPLVGLFTDRRPQPYSLPFGMGCTLLGSGHAGLRAELSPCCSPAQRCSGSGAQSSIRNRRASRGWPPAGAHGLAQSLFQVGGNVGHALGPLLGSVSSSCRADKAASHGSLWLRLSAWSCWRRSAAGTRLRSRTRPATSGSSVGMPRCQASQVWRAIAVLIALIFSKFFYLASITSYYIFYLIHRFNLPTETAQIYLFVFLAAAAAGTFIGGPVGDRFGRRRSSGARSSAFCLSRWCLPYVGLTATIFLSVVDRARAVLGILGDSGLCAGADAGPGWHGFGSVLRSRLRNGRRRRRGAWACSPTGPASSSSTTYVPFCR